MHANFWVLIKIYIIILFYILIILIFNQNMFLHISMGQNVCASKIFELLYLTAISHFLMRNTHI